MGKTSLLKHLLGNQQQHITPPPNQPPLVLAHLDIQENISNAEQFYGKALRALLDNLPSRTNELAKALEPFRQKLHKEPKATAIEFENVLKSLKEAESGRVRPVLLIDEFERVFEEHLKAGFPFPDFYDGLRSQITNNRLAIALFSREKLVSYFDRQSLSSSFPSYFQPFTLKELDKEAADALLLQNSDHPLTTEQAREARRWAGLHPCHLQCAGAAWYQAMSEGKPREWAKARYAEIVEQLGFINPSHLPVKSVKGLRHRAKKPRVWLSALALVGAGALAWFGKWYWLVKALAWGKENYVIVIILFVLLLIVFGRVSWNQVLDGLIKKLSGGEKEK